MVWTPDIIIIDSAEEKTLRTNPENYLLIVNYLGHIKWHFQTLSQSFCEIDIMNFPFDSQTCSIRIRSSSRDKQMLRILKRNMKVKVKENIKTEWFIINSEVEETSIIITKGSRILEFNVLDFKLTLRRVTTYYFLKIIFPFTIIAFITLFTFLLAPDSGLVNINYRKRYAYKCILFSCVYLTHMRSTCKKMHALITKRLR